MKKLFSKPAILAIVLFITVLLVAPVSAYATNGATLVSIEVTPTDSTICALGQTQQFTAIGYSDGTKTDIIGLTWSSTDPGVATINPTTGLATGVGGGWTEIIGTGTLNGISTSGKTNLYVGQPWFSLVIGLPGEETWGNLYADDCVGLIWSFVIEDKDKILVYKASGSIPEGDSWSQYWSCSSLSEGDYTATLSIEEKVQDTQSFKVWGHEASMDIDIGYAGETTTFTLNATKSSGQQANFQILKSVEDYYEQVDELTIDIGEDPWSESILRNLSEGDYWAGFWIGDSFEDGYDFSIVARGEPKPEPEEEEKPVVNKAKPKPKPKPTPIYELPITRYEKTTTGFLNLLYNRILQRNPEEEGLNAWLAQSGVTGSDLVQSFIFGEECQARISGYTDEQFITFLYKALLGRLPEADGLNAWLSRMAGGMTKEEVVSQFALSEEFVKICKEFGILPYDGYSNGL